MDFNNITYVYVLHVSAQSLQVLKTTLLNYLRGAVCSKILNVFFDIFVKMFLFRLRVGLHRFIWKPGSLQRCNGSS